MNDIKLDNVCFSDNTRTLINADEMVIGNIKNSGLWIKIKIADFDKIKAYIGKKDGFNQLMQSTAPSLRTYYSEIINALAKINVLRRKNWVENDSNIQRLDLELTKNCNLRCKHCCGEYGEHPNISMSQDNFNKIINWAANNNISSISLSGGEIFCLPYISEYLKYARQNFSGNITIVTNATLISPEHLPVLKACVNEISISLDGYDKDSVDFIRGKGVFEKVIKTINLLNDNGFSNLSLSMVLTSDNRKHVDDFKKICANLNLKPILRTLSIHGRALKYYDDLVSDKEKGKADDISTSINMSAICNAGSQTLSINANGKVTLCSAMEESNITLGYISDLDSIVHDVKRINTTCIVDTISPCKDCNVRYFCSSRCHAVNIYIYKNEQLRKNRCKQYKKFLKESVWK